MEEFQKNIKEIIALHDNLSKNIKEFDSTFKIEYPGMSQNSNSGFFNNDLRYALRASIDLLKFAKFANEKEAQKYLSHLITSIHILYNDLLDYTNNFVLSYIEEDVYKNYPAKIVSVTAKEEISYLINIADEINTLIAESRHNRLERITIYENIYQGKFLLLLDGYKKLLKKVVIIRELSDTSTKDKYISYSLAIAGIVVGGIGMIF